MSRLILPLGLTARRSFDSVTRELSSGRIVRAIVPVALAKAADGEEEKRSLSFTISTASVDRYGDTIQADGWRLDAYRKNPVMLWAHNSSQLPVAKATDINVRDSALHATAEFMPAELSTFSDTVFRSYKLGFLSAVSVGFLPIKWAWVEEKDRPFGIDFLEQELLEFSAVPVPANPEALVDSKGVTLPEPDSAGRAHRSREREIEILSLSA